ncbi:uncharacterized protein LOC124607201 isoform X13 [Schistocerca americana]|uniref:uncharacterized protein LOC124607201 isoform X13 n=1 Tax=Schistocerca americana TaxID=7009 RepID=UPI001F4F9C34|nr:uncharacterized protein LOC124607201 isoform X13 [Schistocerca americana]XP_049958978.1 uncharacterized protein LOC126475271 isoform X13 [Schistocerca serialis cubense]
MWEYVKECPTDGAQNVPEQLLLDEIVIVVKQRCILQKPSQEIIIPVKHDGMNELSSSQEYTIIEYICTGECIGELDYDRKKSHCQQKMMNVTTEVKWNPRGVKVMEQKWQIWKWTNW